jgi:Tol biopolymer transport system component
MDGDELKQVTNGDIDIEKIAVSCSGDRVAYTTITDCERPFITDLYVMHLVSGTSTTLTNGDISISAVTWSPMTDAYCF